MKGKKVRSKKIEERGKRRVESVTPTYV